MWSIVQVTKNETCSDTLNSQSHSIFLFLSANDKIYTDILCSYFKVVALKVWHTLNQKVWGAAQKG